MTILKPNGESAVDEGTGLRTLRLRSATKEQVECGIPWSLAEVDGSLVHKQRSRRIDCNRWLPCLLLSAGEQVRHSRK